MVARQLLVCLCELLLLPYLPGINIPGATNIEFESDASAQPPAHSDQRTTTGKLPSVSRRVYPATNRSNLVAEAVTTQLA